MRTKTLLLSAAVGAAGLLAADAQVYSVNSVGYINLTIPPGFSMISNQLKTTQNLVSQILPTPPLGTQILNWNGAGYDILEYADIGFGPGWSGDLALVPGSGVFIRNPTASNMVVTLVGEVPQNADSNITIPAGFSIKSSTVPVAGNVIQSMAFPSALGDQILKWTGAGYDISEYVDIGFGPGWSSEPTVAVGEAFFVKKNAPAAWDRNFSVNQ
jgi:hypothetical protein